MNGWLLPVIIAGVAILGFVAARLGWIDLSNKNRSGGSGGGLGMGDEVFNPSRYEAQVELDRQTVLPAPAPLPGDGDKGIYRGSVQIELEEALDDGAGSAKLG